MKRLLAAGAAGALLLAGCGSNTSGENTPAASGSGAGSTTLRGSITVLAAASLTEAFGTIAKKFEAANPGTSVTLSYGASSQLATQITQGKPADVFASASTRNMTSVTQAGDAANPANFASNTLEIAVPPSNPGKITSLADLAKSGVKVAVCDAAVPCGVVARQVFAKAKLAVKPTASPADVKATLAFVQAGEVDAGLVYVTDVRAAGSKVRGIEIPANVNASTTYPIASLKNSNNKALADAFVKYVLSSQGQQQLAAAGFSAP